MQKTTQRPIRRFPRAASRLASRLALAGVSASLAFGCATASDSASPMTDTTASLKAEPAIPMPGASKLLTQTPEAFVLGCRADLSQSKLELEKLYALDGATQADEVLETFNTIQTLVGNAGARASLIKEVQPDAALRQAGETCEQELEQFSTALGLDRKLFERLSAVKLDGRDVATVTWMTRTVKEMQRSGVDRDDATRAKVQSLNDELVKLGQEFGKNIREDVRFVELAPKQLDGLPEDYRKAHPVGANGKVKITSDYPDYVPFMAYAKDAKARESLWRVYRNRGNPKNLDVLKKMFQKRHELATLLGYPNWAAFITENKMVKSAERASQFIDQVNGAAEAAAKREYAVLLARKRKDSPKATKLEPWEFEHYEDKYKTEAFGYDSQKAREHFEYANVLNGVLTVTSKLFGIKYVEVKDAVVWHPSVRTYDVVDEKLAASGVENGGLLGRIYLDMHPREGKYKHAAQFDLVAGRGGERYPEGVLVCNFPEPGAVPALMQPKEVETFFHEFGHLLHHVFAGKQKWAAQSGVKTEWDFVEVPSMLLQEWATMSEPLNTFAKHHVTGAPIPKALVQSMVAANEFGKGLFTRRQMFLSALSLSYHNREPSFDSTKLATELQSKFEPFRQEMAKGTSFQTSFGHLNGYSAVYYTYIWSSVIARDLLTAFNAEGVMNPAVAARYRQAILEAGGSKDAALLVKDFLGRDFDFKAYEAWLNTQPGAAPAAAPAASSAAPAAGAAKSAP